MLELEATYDHMLGLIVLVLKVQVVWNYMLASLVDSRQGYDHIEFTPSFLLNAEWSALERCVQHSYLAYTSSEERGLV